MAMPGEVHGLALLSDKEFILKERGRKKLEEAQEEIRDMGEELSYGKIEEKKFYPWGKRVLSLLAASRVLRMDNEKVKKMGQASLKRSFWSKFLTRYLSTTKDVFEREVRSWRKKSTVGRLELISVDEKKKEVTLRLYNLNFHPIFCDYFEGYLQAVGELNKGVPATCMEKSCYFRAEGPFHEFLLKW